VRLETSLEVSWIIPQHSAVLYTHAASQDIPFITHDVAG